MNIKFIKLKCFFLLFFSINSYGQQITPSELELIDVVKKFRESTISFGVVGLRKFNDIDGYVVTKKIFNPIGTGVCFYLNINNVIMPCIITAKHVLNDKQRSWRPDSLNIRFSDFDSLSIDNYFGIPLVLNKDSVSYWTPHPDSTIDLACIVLDPTYNWPVKYWPTLPYSTFANDEDYFEGKEIYTLGYPSAVGIDLLNRSFLRRGIIAWIDKRLRKENKKILIDCNIFPGNSGGPVFSVSKNQGQILSDTVLQLPKFYGIVSQRRFSENIISSNNGTIKDVYGSEIYSLESIGVGVIVTAAKVRELLEFVKKTIEKDFK